MANSKPSIIDFTFQPGNNLEKTEQLNSLVKTLTTNDQQLSKTLATELIHNIQKKRKDR